MYRRDRAVVAEFATSELLFLRYARDHFVGDQLDVAAIRFPRTSVNRGLFSVPEDALFSEEGRYNGLGVVAFPVSDIPNCIQQDDGPSYFFSMRHAPLDDNYAHSEIWSNRHPGDTEYREPSKTIKLKFRLHLSRRIRREQIRIEAALA